MLQRRDVGKPGCTSMPDGACTPACNGLTSTSGHTFQEGRNLRRAGAGCVRCDVRYRAHAGRSRGVVITWEALARDEARVQRPDERQLAVALVEVQPVPDDEDIRHLEPDVAVRGINLVARRLREKREDLDARWTT
jgi:hypothetical protein